MFIRGNVPWNKGHTKETHPGLQKMARTLSAKKEWNFSRWQRSQPKIDYSLNKTEDWAELVGVTLGDGCLTKFPRTEKLTISCNSKETEHIQHIRRLIENVFRKSPAIKKRKLDKCTDVTFYQCRLSKRLQIPVGNKLRNKIKIPASIFNNKLLLIKCLKGIFETDGSFSVDKKNYTRVIELTNFSQTLLKDTYFALKSLNYNPQIGKKYVRLARKNEVYDFIKLIRFRKY